MATALVSDVWMTNSFVLDNDIAQEYYLNLFFTLKSFVIIKDFWIKLLRIVYENLSLIMSVYDIWLNRAVSILNPKHVASPKLYPIHIAMCLKHCLMGDRTTTCVQGC